MSTTIVIGVTNQATALAACARALELARATDANVHLVYAIDEHDPHAESTARRHADGLLESLALSSSLPMTVHTVIGHAADAILQVAATTQADVIVIGNKGLTRHGRFTHETPAQVLRKATCSVLVIDTSAALLPKE